MTAKIKGLKIISHNKDEVFIIHRYRGWRHATENFRLQVESDCPKNYVKQLSSS